MNAELDLFTSLTRTTDPETSRAAGRRQGWESLEYQWDMIVKALREHGPMNYSQIDVKCKWDHPKAARRLHELVDRDRIQATGLRTPTHTGSPATVYRVMP